MISSMSTTTATFTVERIQKDGSRVYVTCPQAVASGVDKGDQPRNYYRVRLKSSKYCKYIFWLLLGMIKHLLNVISVLKIYWNTSTLSMLSKEARQNDGNSVHGEVASIISINVSIRLKRGLYTIDTKF